MISRIAAAIARAIASIGKEFWDSLPTIGRTLDDLIRWPFSLFVGGNAPVARYEPTMNRSDVLENFKAARQAAAVHAFDPSGIETVRKFCAAPAHQRVDMDISAVPAEPRAILLTMSDDELFALGNAAPGQVKKFLDGKRHEIDGVPVVGIHKALPLPKRSPRPELDHRLWAVQARLQKAVENRFKVG